MTYIIYLILPVDVRCLEISWSSLPPPLYLLPSSTQLWRASSINKQGTVQSTIAIDNLYTTHLPAIIAKKQPSLTYASHSLNYQVKGWKVRTKYVQGRWI